MEKILEKSGNFVSLEKWEPWKNVTLGFITLPMLGSMFLTVTSYLS